MLRPHWAGFQNVVDDWANLYLYLVIFIYGYPVFASDELLTSIERNRWFHLALGVGITVFLILCFASNVLPMPLSAGVQEAVGNFFRGVNVGLWLVAFVGFRAVLFNRPSRILTYANEAVNSFYVLHQTVTIALVFFVVKWPTGIF
ncbi:MAG TPA: hypothetical protein QGG93_08085 [Verrucomicrobiota bacterium]|nr:hypothetical protein [Verrucomicrobiota bacterium]